MNMAPNGARVRNVIIVIGLLIIVIGLLIVVVVIVAHVVVIIATDFHAVAVVVPEEAIRTRCLRAAERKHSEDHPEMNAEKGWYPLHDHLRTWCTSLPEPAVFRTKP